MAATNRPEQAPESSKASVPLTVAFEGIADAGCYISNATGDLFRIPPDALAQGRSPLISITSRDQFLVTKICDDPWIPISKARQLAADGDLPVNF